MGGQPVTTNPVLIMLINMTVVFAVLYGLSLVVRLIRHIDPTREKEVKMDVRPAAVKEAVPEPAAGGELTDASVVVILAAAVAAYGYSAEQITSIRRTDSNSVWTQNARCEAVNTGSQK